MSFHKPIAFFFLLVIVACNKGGAGRDAEPPDPSMYLLTEIKAVSSGLGHDHIYTISYNAQNQVSEIKWVYRVPGGPGQDPGMTNTTVTFSFNYQNNLAVQCTRKSDLETKIINYYYEGNRVKYKVAKSNQGAQIDSTIYNYDPNGKPGEVFAYLDNRLSARLEFIYSDDLIIMTSYLNGFSSATKAKTEYSGYDSNVSFITAVKGLPPLPGVTDFPFARDLSLSANNYRTLKAYGHVGTNDEFKAPWLNMNCSYEYNNAGLPTIMKLTGGQHTFKYQIIKQIRFG